MQVTCQREALLTACQIVGVAAAARTTKPILSNIKAIAVEDSLTLEQEVSHLKDAILRLKDQERVVLSLYYFEELKLHEIAKVLELTESRVSQIRSKALSKLRVELKPLRGRVA